MKNWKYNSFNCLVNLLCKTSNKQYMLVVGSLIVIGTMCNNTSDKPLPMFWLLVAGFAFVIYTDIYSIRQIKPFLEHIEKSMAGDLVLRDEKEKLIKKFYSNWNWIAVFLVPTLIVPTVIYIIQYPLGLPIKIFAYTALFFIIALCVISYSEYVYLIIFSFNLYKSALHIKKYNRERPHKTDWLCILASTTNKQSNCFFITGTNFIFLLALITLSGHYGVSLEKSISLFLVGYLWLLIAVGIVFMFTVFSLCSYLFIRLLINGLTQKSIDICETDCRTYAKGKNKKCRELIELTKMKILLLEQTPSYPQKPFVCYAISFIVGIINFAATLDSVNSLRNYIVAAIH
ncbi:MAG: hypothetical protein K2O16_02540 [Lachnospiraceae bacterium]|nr:hypothetical protein [Lachnospiraceae bacterium]